MATTVSDFLPPLPGTLEKNAKAHAENLKIVESKFSAAIFAMRIRIREIFQDYDAMRSGLMTDSRFVRCIEASLDRVKGIQLNKRELDVLIKEYGIQDSKVRWRDFVNKMDQVFGAKLNENGLVISEGLGDVTTPYRRPLSPKSESKVAEIMTRLKAYGKHHGANPKSWFHDFDHSWVNYNQFRRGMPQNLISAKDEDLLLERYGDADSETVNYFQLHSDVTRKAPKAANSPITLVAKLHENDHLPVGTEEIWTHHDTKHLESHNLVEDKIRQFVYKNRIRLFDLWRDYDRHNNGLITETQFITGLRLARLPIDTSETLVVIKKYSIPDGRIEYRNFCTSIESVFTTLNLEQNPLLEIKMPSREFLNQGSNILNEADQKHCAVILARLQRIVRERRLLLTPFFKDFDKSLGNMGRVTKSHFSRLLFVTGLCVSDQDLHILFKKFEEKSEGRINYRDFIRQIDPDSYICNMPQHAGAPKAPEPAASKISSATVFLKTLPALIDSIQAYVIAHRVRVSEVFRDFDKLRSYSIRSDDFVRGLYCLGYRFEPSDIELLRTSYADPQSPKYCKWKTFSDEIDLAFTLENKERSPFANTGTELSAAEKEILGQAIFKIRNHLRFRKTSFKSFFRDCDKICSGIGHVTKSQLRQCMTFMECDVTNDEFNVICKNYAKKELYSENTNGEYNYIKDKGTSICYIVFLADIEKGLDVEEEAPVSSTRALKKKTFNTSGATITIGEKFEKLMFKIKTKTKTERVRVIDFLADFDPLRHGKISINEFRRAVKMIYTDLTEDDLQTLEFKYLDKDGKTVTYVTFADDVESVFTKKGLVNDPLGVVEPFNVK